MEICWILSMISKDLRVF